MKKFILALSAAALLTACSNNQPRTATAETKVVAPPVDTAGLAQFQAWKAQNELAVANQTAQNNQVATTTPTPEPKEKIVYVEKKPAPKRTTHTTRTSSSNTTSTNNTASTNNEGVYNSSADNTATAKKTGWSKTAKGAVIGGAGGAVLGAVINKRNRVAGGVIGGILGAGGGAIIGNAKDKKDGRH